MARAYGEREGKLALQAAASQRALASPGGDAPGHPVKTEAAQHLLEQQRQALIEERDAHRLDDETLREVLEVIDMEQAVLASRASGEGRAG